MSAERFGLGISNCRPAADVVARVRRAEELGAEIAFVAEDINCRDAFQMLALSARETSTIRLATGVVNPFTRNPTSLAMATATLDEISGGRAVLGMGTSSPALIEGQMGIAHDRSMRVLRESAEIVRDLLAGDAVTHAGEMFRYANAQLEVRTVQSRVPIYFAAMGPATLRLVGRIADGVLLNVGASTDYVRWAISEIEAGATAAGRAMSEITIAAWLTVYVSTPKDDGLQRARQWLATMLSIPRQGELLLEHAGFDSAMLAPIRELVSGYPHEGDRTAAAQFVPPQVARALAIVGDRDEVRRRVQEYRDAGVQVPVVGSGALTTVAGT